MNNHTPAEDSLIRLLRSQGIPAVEIAQRLNRQFHTRRTKRSVIARALRIGCPVISRDEQGMNGKIQAKFHNDGNYTKPVAVPVNTGDGITIHELTEKTCRYPTNDEKRLFCGEQTHYKSYCLKHQTCYAGSPEIKL